jgi:hypothetical protein
MFTLAGMPESWVHELRSRVTWNVVTIVQVHLLYEKVSVACANCGVVSPDSG